MLHKFLIREKERQTREWEKIFANHVFDKIPVSTIHEELLKLNSKKQEQSNLKMSKRHNSHCEEDIQMVNKHIKRCSASLAIREVQIEAAMRYHCTAIRMSKEENGDNPNVVNDVGKNGLFVHC